MTEFKFRNATIRIHGSVDREKVEAATIIYMKKVVKKRKGKKNEGL